MAAAGQILSGPTGRVRRKKKLSQRRKNQKRFKTHNVRLIVFEDLNECKRLGRLPKTFVNF